MFKILLSIYNDLEYEQTVMGNILFSQRRWIMRAYHLCYLIFVSFVGDREDEQTLLVSDIILGKI